MVTVPGKLPSQLEILFTGQTYYRTRNPNHMNLNLQIAWIPEL